MDSPRGRIYLMRAVTDGRLDRSTPTCAVTSTCASTAGRASRRVPSGVQYGKLIEPFRIDMREARRHGGRAAAVAAAARSCSTSSRMPGASAGPGAGPADAVARARSAAGGPGYCLPAACRAADARTAAAAEAASRPAARGAAGRGHAAGAVALFTGCVADAIFPETTWATARVLQTQRLRSAGRRGARAAAGRSTTTPGLEGRGRELRPRRTVPCFRSSAEVDAIIVNVAGCGAMLKDYGHLLARHRRRGRRQAVRRPRCKDISEFLVRARPRPAASTRCKLRATYHDACHLCHAQQIRKPPRQLLEMIPGLELVPLTESGDLLRRGGQLQPDAAGNGRAAGPAQGGEHPRRRAARPSSPATSAACCRSPSTCGRATRASGSPTRSKCCLGELQRPRIAKRRGGVTMPPFARDLARFGPDGRHQRCP